MDYFVPVHHFFIPCNAVWDEWFKSFGECADDLWFYDVWF